LELAIAAIAKASPLTRLLQIPKDSPLAKLQEIMAMERVQPAMSFPLPPPRMAPSSEVTIDDLLAMPQDARQALVKVLLESLQEDGANP
jgi:hypothetical protein